MLFRGFDYFVQSLIATLLMLIPALVIFIPAYIGFFAAIFASIPKQPGAPADPGIGLDHSRAYGLLFLLILVVSIVLNVLFFFTYPLIVDRGLTGVQAVGTSFPRGAGELRRRPRAGSVDHFDQLARKPGVLCRGFLRHADTLRSQRGRVPRGVSGRCRAGVSPGRRGRGLRRRTA